MADTGTIPPIQIIWSLASEIESDPGSPTDMPRLNLNPEILTAALQGLEAQKARLESQIAEVRRMLRPRAQQPAAPASAPKPKRKLSAAARKRMAAAQKARWAEYHQKRAAAEKKAK